MHSPPNLPNCETIAGKRILFIMAIEDEYGPHLRSRFTPLMTGVGPIEAAVSTSSALHHLHHHDALPDLAVSLGSAGSRTCQLGEVYQVASVSWRDMDASRLGFAKGVTPFINHPVDLPLHTPLDLPTARLSTGANIVGGEEYALIDAEMVDMETFAIARACQRFDVPLMGLRGISDGPGELNHMLGWTKLLALLDEKLSHAIDILASRLAACGGWFWANERPGNEPGCYIEANPPRRGLANLNPPSSTSVSWRPVSWILDATCAI